MNLDEIIKSMQALQEEVAKTNETIEQINQTITSMEDELEQSYEKEKEEINAVHTKWANTQSELTKGIADAKQKKQLIEDSSKSLNAAVQVIEALFRIQSESLPKADIKDGLDILRDKAQEGLTSDDFDEIEQELGIVDERIDSPDIEEPTLDETG